MKLTKAAILQRRFCFVVPYWLLKCKKEMIFKLFSNLKR